MPSIRSILIYGLSICSFCTSNQNLEERKELSIDEVVRLLPEESVRAALREHLAPKYREGVFEHGKNAIEVIKDADPQLAAKVVDEALQMELLKSDLEKRQSDNSSTTTSSPPSSPSSTTSSTPLSSSSSNPPSSPSSNPPPSTTSNSPSNPPPGQYTSHATKVSICRFQESTKIDSVELRMLNSVEQVESSKSVNVTATLLDNPSNEVVASQTWRNVDFALDCPSIWKAAPVTFANASLISSIFSSRFAVQSTSSSPPETQTGVIVPVTVVTTDDSGQTTTQTTSAFQKSAETSTVIDETTTDDSGNTITTQATVPAEIVTTTNNNGDTITTAKPLSTARVVNGGTILSAYTTTDSLGNSVVVSGTKSGQVITTTDAAGKTVVMTYTPGGGAVSELVQKTKTLPNGQQTTLTSFAVVGGATQGADQTGGRGSPGLQTNFARPTGRYVGEMAAMFGGAIGVAAML